MVLRMQKGILAPEEANITFPTTLTSVQTEMKGLEEFGNSYGPINGADGEGTARVLNGRVSVDDLNTEGDVPDAHSFRSELSTGMALCLQRIKAEGGMSKYCAALEVEEPSTFTEALDLAMDIDDYELVSGSEQEYARKALRRIGADDELLDTIDGYTDFDSLGRAMMEEDGVRQTGFGLVRRLSKPFPEPEIGQAMM